MEIARILSLSTVHLPQTVMEHISDNPDDFSFTVAPYDAGAFLSTHNPEASENLALYRVLLFAKAGGFGFVQFDRDAGEISGLPVFEWGNL